MLVFDSSWRFVSIGPIAAEVNDEFHTLISRVATGRQDVIEEFKSKYASAAGRSYSRSSSASWADSDLQSYMADASANAPLFIEAFYDGMEAVKKNFNLPVPDVAYINLLLAKHKSGFQIELPRLYAVNGDIAPMQAPSIPKSFDDEAKEIIQKSLYEANRLLTEKRERQAVQELLWLLETITTAFQGMTSENNETIGGNYFNRIIPELRRVNKGKATEHILKWIENLHGYLSAPKGGQVRHGADLKEGVVTSSAEATLYYDLTLSYIKYIISEYDRLSKHAKTTNWL